MADPTYLYSYGSGPHDASPTRRTRGYIQAQGQFSKVDPELMDRLFRLCDRVIAAGGDYGFGGGWRSSLQQRNLFLSRYTRIQTTQAPNPGRGLWWDGSPSWPQDAGWYVHTSGAPSAPPGRSYHESTTNGGLGFALAVDMVGTHNIGNAMAAAHGLNSFEDVNAEPWHYQPIEIPNARRNYTGQFENPSQWFPTTPPTQPPPPIGDMMGLTFQPTDETKARVFDSRKAATADAGGNQGKKLDASGRVTVHAHRASLPPNTKAVAVNVTAVDVNGGGYLSAWASGNMPEKSCVNYTTTGDTRNGFTIVPISSFGTFELAAGVNGCHAIVDVVGAFMDEAA
jgi:hypothetical protein